MSDLYNSGRASCVIFASSIKTQGHEKDENTQLVAGDNWNP